MMNDAEKWNNITEKSLSVILERMIVFCYQSKVNETAIFEVVSTDGPPAVGTYWERKDALSNLG